MWEHEKNKKRRSEREKKEENMGGMRLQLEESDGKATRVTGEPGKKIEVGEGEESDGKARRATTDRGGGRRGGGRGPGCVGTILWSRWR